VGRSSIELKAYIEYCVSNQALGTDMLADLFDRDRRSSSERSCSHRAKFGGRYIARRRLSAQRLQSQLLCPMLDTDSLLLEFLALRMRTRLTTTTLEVPASRQSLGNCERSLPHSLPNARIFSIWMPIWLICTCGRSTPKGDMHVWRHK